MKKIMRIILWTLIVFFSTNISVKLFAQSVVLKEVEIKEDDKAVRMLFPMTMTIPVECYDLTVPPQIVVDFMGEIYTNQPEVVLINKGVVKQMRVIKGTKQAADLDQSYYPVDFVIMDLKEPVRYDFDQGLTNAVLIVTKPAVSSVPVLTKEEVVTKPEEKKAAAPGPKVEEKKPETIVVEKKAEALTSAPVVEQKAGEKERVSLGEKEYEAPIAIGTKELSAKEVPPEMPGGEKEKKVSSFKKVGTGIFKGIGKLGKGIKSIFSSKKQDKEQPEEVTKKTRNIAVKRKEKPREISKDEKKKMTTAKPSILTEPEKRLELVKQKKTEKEREIAKISQELTAAKAELEKSKTQEEEINKELKAARQTKEKTKEEFDTSIKQAGLAKNTANAAWTEYSSAKENLSRLLTEGTEAGLISDAEKKYDAKKAMLEKAITSAEQAKAVSNEKLSAYHKAKEEFDELMSASAQPRKSIELAQKKYNETKERYDTAVAEMTEIEQELAAAERACKQYELEKAQKKYQASLSQIDSSLAKISQSKEEEEKIKEEARKEEIKKEELRKEQLRKEEINKEEAKKEELRKEELKREEAKRLALKKAEEKSLEEEKKETGREKKIKPKRRKSQEVTEKAAERKAAPAKEVTKSTVELRNAGLEMQKAGDMDQAMKYYQEALMLDQKYVTVHNDLGILYEQRGLDDKAKNEYLAALKLDPKYVRAHSNLALLYEKLGDYNKAYYHWKQRVELGNPDDPWTRKAKEKLKEYEQKKK